LIKEIILKVPPINSIAITAIITNMIKYVMASQMSMMMTKLSLVLTTLKMIKNNQIATMKITFRISSQNKIISLIPYQIITLKNNKFTKMVMEVRKVD
jgi:hypothetical protein